MIKKAAVLKIKVTSMELTSSWQLRDPPFFSLQLFVAVIAVSALSAPTTMIRVTPPALLVPNNTRIVLKCQVHDGINNAISVRWFMMDRANLVPQDFYHDPQVENNNIIHKIEFNATAGSDVNHTNISCLIDNDSGMNWSNNVSLIILTDTEFPEPRNPWLVEHQTYFQLKWSPLYLWRGYYIDYFIITVIDLNDGSIVKKRVNVSKNLSDRYIESYNHTKSKRCSDILFVIKAFSRYDGMLNGTFRIRGNSHSDPTDFVPPLNTIYFFNANATPHLITEVELPQVCPFEEVAIEYTITTNDSNKPIYTETFSHIGWGVVNHMLDSANLTINQYYNLKVVITNAKDLRIENFKNFDTFLTCGTAGRNQIRNWLLMSMFLIFVYIVL